MTSVVLLRREKAVTGPTADSRHFADALVAEGVPVLRALKLAAVPEVEAAVGHVVGVVAVPVALVLRVRATPVFRRVVQTLTFLRGGNSDMERTSWTHFFRG